MSSCKLRTTHLKLWEPTRLFKHLKSPLNDCVGPKWILSSRVTKNEKRITFLLLVFDSLYFLFCQTFFFIKLQLLNKSSAFMILGVTNVTLVSRFMKSNKFFCVQTAKVANSKNVSCQRIKFCPWWRILSFFQILIF